MNVRRQKSDIGSFPSEFDPYWLFLSSEPAFHLAAQLWHGSCEIPSKLLILVDSFQVRLLRILTGKRHCLIADFGLSIVRVENQLHWSATTLKPLPDEVNDIDRGNSTMFQSETLSAGVHVDVFWLITLFQTK